MVKIVDIWESNLAAASGASGSQKGLKMGLGGNF